MMLTATGTGAPASEAIISASLTYGALGSCQSASMQLAQASAVEHRAAVWTLSLGSPMFFGVVEQVLPVSYGLTSVTLSAAHRVTLDALGEPLGAPYPLQTAGVVVDAQTLPHERMSEVLNRLLERWPHADYGVTAHGTTVLGLPEHASRFSTLLAGDALEIRALGYTEQRYVTDAVFDPGEGWPKYTYKRTCPGWIHRKTAHVTMAQDANSVEAPKIISAEDTDITLTRVTTAVPSTTTDGVTHVYNNVIECDNIEKQYAEVDSTATQIMSDVGLFRFQGKPDLPDRKHRKIKIRCPFLVGKIAAYPVIQAVPVVHVPVSSGPDVVILTPVNEQIQNLSTALNTVSDQTRQFRDERFTARGTPKNGELKLLISLTVENKILSTQVHVFKEQDIGLEQAVSFEMAYKNQEGEKKDVDIEVRYEMTEQDTGKSIKITFRPIEVAIEYETPNLTQVRMPEGWQTPFFTGPSYELKFRGWHVPPLQITGLSGGIQYAAGSTVTWDKSECTTTVTTGTWGAK